MNIVIITGNLTRDVEMRYLQDGKAIAKFAIAHHKKWKDDSGPKEKTFFFNCVAFGRKAEVVGQYFRKGSLITVQGKLEMDEWLDKQTQQKRQAAVIVMDEFEFMDNKSNPEPAARPQPAHAAAGPEEDDVPF